MQEDVEPRLEAEPSACCPQAKTPPKVLQLETGHDKRRALSPGQRDAERPAAPLQQSKGSAAAGNLGSVDSTASRSARKPRVQIGAQALKVSYRQDA